MRIDFGKLTEEEVAEIFKQCFQHLREDRLFELLNELEPDQKSELSMSWSDDE